MPPPGTSAPQSGAGGLQGGSDGDLDFGIPVFFWGCSGTVQIGPEQLEDMSVNLCTSPALFLESNFSNVAWGPLLRNGRGGEVSFKCRFLGLSPTY